MKHRSALPMLAALALAALFGSLTRPAGGDVAKPGTIVTVAGTGTPGDAGDNGPATQALLNEPSALAIDGAGNLYIADAANYRVRKVSPGGTITTVAGVRLPQFLHVALLAIVSLFVMAAAIDGLLRVDDDHRTQMRWVGTALILSSFIGLSGIFLFSSIPIRGVTALQNSHVLLTDVPMLIIAYAVLRHRIVDLSIVISRAAIFSFVSITLVALFIAGEWAAIEVLDRTAGPRAAAGGAGQALTLAIALAVGAEPIMGGGGAASLPRSFIDQIGPDAPGLGLAGPRRQHRDRRVVGMDHRRRHHMGSDHLRQRHHPPGDMTDPIGKARPFDRYAFAGQNRRWTIER